MNPSHPHHDGMVNNELPCFVIRFEDAAIRNSLGEVRKIRVDPLTDHGRQSQSPVRGYGLGSGRRQLKLKWTRLLSSLRWTRKVGQVAK